MKAYTMDLRRFIFLLLSCTTLFTVNQCQRVLTSREVIGYQKHDVTLPCQYIQGSTKDNLVQVQWTWQNYSNKSDSMTIIVNDEKHGIALQNTFLKDRVNFKINSNLTSDASIIIKDVKMTDQGVYSCEYATHPRGSEKGKTTLKVKEGNPPVLSTGATAGIVVVVLVIIFLAAVSYLLLIKRRRAACTSAYYVTKSPDDFQEGEVTYADVTILNQDKVKRNTLLTGDTEYAAVSFSNRSGTTSQQVPANQLAFGAHTAEYECMYTEVNEEYNF